MGLLDIFTSDDPAKQQGLLGLYASLLQNGGPSLRPTSFGQNFGAALGAYQQGLQGAQDRQQQQSLYDLRLKGLKGELDDAETTRQQKRAIEQAARDSLLTPGMQALAGGGGPTNANAANIPNMQGGFDVEGFLNRATAINPLTALELRKSLAKAGPKFDSGITWVNGPDGKPVAVRTADDGSIKQLDGLSPREKLHFLNTGGKTIGVDEYTGTQGVSFANSVDPDTIYSGNITMRGQNMTDARERQQAARPVFNAEAGGFVLPPSAANPGGKLLQLDGFNRAGKLTEDQAKATGWLVQAENAYKNLRSVAFDKDGNLTSAVTPGFGDAVASIPGFGALGNKFRSADRQKFNQAASSMSEAFLRAATGAGVNRDEALQKVQELTPVWGEDSSVTQQKLDAIPLYIDSLRVRAGPGAVKAAGVLAPKAAAGGWSITKVE